MSNYRIPAYMPIDSILIEDIRMKRLLKDMPNCSGIGIVFGLFFHLLKNEKQQCRYDDIDIIADELRTSVPMVVTVIENYGFFSIFEDDLGKKFFSPALDKALVFRCRLRRSIDRLLLYSNRAITQDLHK